MKIEAFFNFKTIFLNWKLFFKGRQNQKNLKKKLYFEINLCLLRVKISLPKYITGGFWLFTFHIQKKIWAWRPFFVIFLRVGKTKRICKILYLEINLCLLRVKISLPKYITKGFWLFTFHIQKKFELRGHFWGFFWKNWKQVKTPK